MIDSNAHEVQNVVENGWISSSEPEIRLRERTSHPVSSTKTKKTPHADDFEASKEEKLVCGVCRLFITTTTSRIELFGAHVHHRMNPAGMVFRLGLFAEAPGVLTITEPSFEFTWFTGYAWQIVVCRVCLEHLGWEFRGEKRFFALLPEKLEVQRTE